MTSVRNSYIVISSFPGSASSPHSLQKFLLSLIINLLRLLYPAFLSASNLGKDLSLWHEIQTEETKPKQEQKQVFLLSSPPLSAVFPSLGMSNAAAPLLSDCPAIPHTPTSLPPHLTEALQSLSTLKLSIFFSSSRLSKMNRQWERYHTQPETPKRPLMFNSQAFAAVAHYLFSVGDN